MLQGTEVVLADMLECRERRAMKQYEFLHSLGRPVISFCMNIPGPIKTTPEIRKLFEEGASLIFQALSAESWEILASAVSHEKTGDELILCVACGEAARLKEKMTAIEERHPLGRLFDIDVIDLDGNKLSRASFRKCFICGRQAQECAAARRHSVKEMQDVIEAGIKGYLSQKSERNVPPS